MPPQYGAVDGDDRPAAGPTRLAVCIATTGRRDVLTEAIRVVATQSRRPHEVIVCPAKPEDVDRDALARLAIPVRILDCGSGLTRQRNMLLRAAGDADIVLFIDDDFLLAPDFVERLVELFASRADCVMATGSLVADGALGIGLTVAEGMVLLEQAAQVAPPSRSLAPVYNAYGCNMAVRWSALRHQNCWFDEGLPLYGWAEDVDFSRQAARHGTVLKSGALVGVHLGVKFGRVSGVRFGYSQIANQVYLVRKGTLTLSGSILKLVENLGANGLGTLRNWEPHIDRRGRLLGNLYAVRDLCRGRLSPGRIMEL